jgi:hypothetical protein
MHKILGRVAEAGRLSAASLGFAVGRAKITSRSAAAAARLHPAGVAVPSAVLAAAIVLFTFVTSVTIRVIPPPSAFGSGSAQAATPSTGQPRYQIQPQRPVQPVEVVQPVQAIQPGQTSNPGQDARSLTGSLEQIVSPLPVSPAAPPPAPGQAPAGIRNPSSSQSGGVPVCDVRHAPSSAATATATNITSTQPGIAQVLKGASGVPSDSPRFGVRSSSTGQSAGASALSVRFVPAVNVPVWLGGPGSGNGSVRHAPSSAATVTATNVTSAQPGVTQVQRGLNQAGWDQGDPPQTATRNNSPARAPDAPASSARSAPSVNVPVSLASPGSGNGPVTQTLAAGTATAAAG